MTKETTSKQPEDQEVDNSPEATKEDIEVSESMPKAFRSFIAHAIEKAHSADKKTDGFKPTIDDDELIPARDSITQYLENAYTSKSYLSIEEWELLENATDEDFDEDALFIEENLDVFSDFDEDDVEEFMREKFYPRFLSRMFERVEVSQSERQEEEDAEAEIKPYKEDLEKFESQLAQFSVLPDLTEDMKAEAEALQEKLHIFIYGEEGSDTPRENISLKAFQTTLPALISSLSKLYAKYLSAKEASQEIIDKVKKATKIDALEEALTEYETALQEAAKSVADKVEETKETVSETYSTAKEFMTDLFKDPWKAFKNSSGLFKIIAGFALAFASTLPFIGDKIFKDVSTEEAAEEGFELICDLASGKKAGNQLEKEEMAGVKSDREAAVTWLSGLKDADGKEVYTGDANTDFAGSIFNSRFTVGDLKGFTADDPSKIDSEKVANSFSDYVPALQAILDKVVVEGNLLQSDEYDGKNLAKYIKDTFKPAVAATDTSDPTPSEDEQAPA